MKGNAQVLSKLNEVLTAELTSINQYFLHARIYKNWGLKALNDVCYKKSIKDMKQADELIERILMLEGLPNLQALGKLRIGEDTPEMLQCDMDFQIEQLPLLRATIALCEAEQDYVSRNMLQQLLDDTEQDHAHWLEQQLNLIKLLGLPNYLQSQMGEE